MRRGAGADNYKLKLAMLQHEPPYSRRNVLTTLVCIFLTPISAEVLEVFRKVVAAAAMESPTPERSVVRRRVEENSLAVFWVQPERHEGGGIIRSRADRFAR